MPTFEISINIYLFLLILITAGLLGFLQRARKLAKKDRKIAELEQEMMQAYAELLETQKEFCDLELRVKEVNSPVIAMKNNKVEDPPKKPSDRRDNIRKDRATGTD